MATLDSLYNSQIKIKSDIEALDNRMDALEAKLETGVINAAKATDLRTLGSDVLFLAEAEYTVLSVTDP